MEKKSLGAFIAFLRKENKLTQKQLAELLNVSDKTVSHWECDETSPDISLLPTLAKILGVSVDELLDGEKKSDSPPHGSFHYYEKSPRKRNYVLTKIKEGFSGEISERYRYFRLFSLAGAVIALVVIMSIGLSVAFSGFYFASSIPIGLITLFGSLWTIVLSLALTIGARFLFSKELIAEKCSKSQEKQYVYKANRITFNNIFLSFCAFPLSLTGIDILPIGANLLIALAFVAATRLIASAILTKKGYLCKNDHQQLAVRYISICLVSVITISLSVLFFTEEIYHPSTEKIIFYNADDFKAYMETPAEKPEDAYMIDGVYATTEPPTAILTPDRNDETFSPVVEIEEYEESEHTETVYGDDGEKILTFVWRNKAVDYYTHNNDDEGNFHVITYEAEIKAKNQEIFINDFTPIFLVVFFTADVIFCTVLYKRKKALLSQQPA